MAETLRVVIADDEPLARQRIEDLLAKEKGIEIAGMATTGDEAVETIRRVNPDLVFLDVQMPGKTGLEVVQDIGAEQMPLTIFITAYDQYALDAFDIAAVDYLVKPFDDERFAQSLQRARKRLRAVPRQGQYRERIAVESRGQVRVVAVAKIDYITASGPYAELHVADKTYAVRERMQTLEEHLDPAVFFRIHRSAIVRLDRIDTLLHRAGGDYALRLKDGTELDVSRGRREELERRLGITRK
ncbi:MAG TPA: LytTR family DNA-binding domain-containing protein [Thermoanaerobaculia bacterium]|nr:LytTR family DNA-binding domain-containing protein [Thermoanaerobaculia bacterium]